MRSGVTPRLGPVHRLAWRAYNRHDGLAAIQKAFLQKPPFARINTIARFHTQPCFRMGDIPSNDASIEEKYPFHLTELDKWTLAQTDEEFKKHDWDELKRIIGESRVFAES